MAFNQKNPPWQRNTGHQNISNMQAIVNFPQAQPVYNPNIGLQQQQNISILPQMNIQQQAMYSQTVQYPTARPMNPLGFQNQPQSQPTQPPVNQNSSKFNPNKRVFSGTGMVTKLQNDFGFIDDEVFFHKNICVKGLIPKVGDRVLVDAAYNSNMPFKWNASRVQVLQNSNANSSPATHVNSSQVRSHGSMYNNVPPSSSDTRLNTRNRYSPPARKTPDRHVHRSSNSRSKDEYDDSERRRKRDERDSDRTPYREKHPERSTERGRERERSPIRKSSPKRRRVCSVPRYSVQVPKHLLTIKNADVLELRRRYTNLYIPSDFFISDIRWSEAFAPDTPFSIRSSCNFHVMHKDVEPPSAMAFGNETSLDPPDADYLFSAKVMLMSTPSLSEFFDKCISKDSGESDRNDEERDYMHPTRLISFLVGMRGKNETMAIGGPWSPSLDGGNPHSDQTVLIRTAVRTCRALTGIDLSGCSQWYRFVELYYRRSESYHKGRLIPPRVETVVIFLPDVRSCQPTRLEWEQIRLSYKASLARVINCSSSNSSNVEEAPSNADSSSSAVAQVTQNSENSDDVAKSSTTPSAVAPSSIAAAPAAASVAEPSVAATGAVGAGAAAAVVASEHMECDGASSSAVVAETAESTLQQKAASASEEKESSAPATRSGSSSSNINTSTSAGDSIMDTTEVSVATDSAMEILIEFKKMKVVELKAELNNRNLPTDGVKAVLLSRLSDAIIKEQKKLLQQAQLQKNAVQELVSTDAKVKIEKASEQELQTGGVMEEVPQKRVNNEPREETQSESASKAPVTTATAPGVGSDVAMETDIKPSAAVAAVAVARKKEEPVKLNEKEKQALERRYQLPEKPHFIVHPSRAAKSGKFDCSVISLSVLLDYRPEDTKEHSFEVALFAELFNEMLTRDFGFNIYRALYKLPSAKKESEESKKDGTPVEGSSKINSSTSNSEEGLNAAGAVASSDKGDESKKKNHGDDKEQRDRKRARHYENTDDERRSKDNDYSKTVVVDSDLLLSFLYFDVTHCGYMVEKDVEDLIYTLGLNLSRSQIRKMVGKAALRVPLYYRNLTDKALVLPTKPQSENAASLDETVDAGKSSVVVADTELVATSDDDAVRMEDQLENDEPEVVARGNIDYKTQLKASVEQILKEQNSAAQLPQHHATIAESNALASTNETGIVAYNGCIIDVGKLLEQVKRAESAREEAEKLLVSVQTENEKLLSSNTRANSKIKDLQADTKSLNKQLADSIRTSRAVTQTQTDYYHIIQDVYERVRHVASKSGREGTGSVPSWKRESSKEKSSRFSTSKSKEKESPKHTRREEDKCVKEKSDTTTAKIEGGDDDCGSDGAEATNDQAQPEHVADSPPLADTDAEAVKNVNE